MAYQSPYESPYDSPTPPHGGFAYTNAAVYGAAQQIPATRAYARMGSNGEFLGSSRMPFSPSPRYDSSGRYATANVNVSPRKVHKTSVSGEHQGQGQGHTRHRSFSCANRTGDSQAESDEDESIEVDGVTYVLHPRIRSSRPGSMGCVIVNEGAHGTDRLYYSQEGRVFAMSPGYATPAPEQDYPPKASRSRRNSQSTPQRPHTARPSSSHKKTAKPPRRKATELDAKRFKIPKGYSLKNWDPAEEPILLLGSVFDANSLGKWIYDWTVYHHGSATPISDMAGELWLLLIQLSGKVKRAEDMIPDVRLKANREILEDFVDSGDRLTDRFRELLKSCQVPMLRAAKKTGGQLGKDAGVQFVKTLFDRDRELERAERFMQAVRLWSMRFDANCNDIMRNPTK